MNRVVADRVPRAAEAEIGTGQGFQAEHFLIEVLRPFDFRDPDRRMAEAPCFDHDESPLRETLDWLAIYIRLVSIFASLRLLEGVLAGDVASQDQGVDV